MRFVAHMELNVVIRRLYPINLIHFHKTDASGGLDHQPSQSSRYVGAGGRLGLMWRNSLISFKQRNQALTEAFDFTLSDLRFGAQQGSGKARVVKWLEQIIAPLHLEGAHGITVISRDKNDCRQPFDAELFHYFKPAQLRHLHVEEEKIGRALFKRF